MFVVNPFPITHRECMIDADESIGGGTVKTRAVSKLFLIEFFLLILLIIDVCIFRDFVSQFIVN